MTGALTAKTAMVHVEGEWLAKHARTLVMEGKWARALKLLTDCLAGMTYETAIAILKGEAELTGWATDEAGLKVGPLPPDGPVAQAMSEGLTRLYGTTFHYQNECWRPYAKVTSWSETDAKLAPQDVAENIIDEGCSESDTPRGQGAARSLYYANSARSDLLIIIAVSSTEDLAVLCEKTATPPLWFDVPQDSPAQAVKSWLDAGFELEERGARIKGEGLLSSVLRASAVDPVIATACSTQTEVPQGKAERIAAIRAQICHQAQHGDGFYRLALTEEDRPYAGRAYLDVPRNPFLLWALAGFAFEKFGKTRPEWRIVSTTGLTPMFDNPYRTDWLLGAGLSPHELGGREPGSLAAVVRSSALRERQVIVRQWTGVGFSILARTEAERFLGVPVVATPYQSVPVGSIALAATAGPEYQVAMRSACVKDRYGSSGLILCASGNQLDNLAVIGRETSSTVLLVEEAVERFRGAKALSIDLEEGKIYHVP